MDGAWTRAAAYPKRFPQVPTPQICYLSLAQETLSALLHPPLQLQSSVSLSFFSAAPDYFPRPNIGFGCLPLEARSEAFVCHTPGTRRLWQCTYCRRGVMSRIEPFAFGKYDTGVVSRMPPGMAVTRDAFQKSSRISVARRR